MAVDRGQRAVPGDALELGGGESRDARLLRAANYGLGQWMLRVSLDRRRQRQDLALGHCIGLNPRDLRFAPGQCSRLVHDHDLDSSSCFDCGRALEQDPAPGAEPGADHDRGGRGEPESIGAGDDDDGDGEEDGLAECAAGQQPDDQRQRAAGQRHQHEPECGPIRKLLPGRLRALGFLDELHNLSQRCFRAHPRRAGPQRSIAVDRTTDELVTRRLRNGEALAGHDRFVHLAGPILDRGIHWDPAARPDEKQVADLHLRGRQLDRLAVPDDDRVGRGEIQQRANGVVGATPRSHFEPVAQEHKSGQDRGRLVEDVSATAEGDDDRVRPAGRDGDRYQHHHVQRPRAQRSNGAREEEPA